MESSSPSLPLAPRTKFSVNLDLLRAIAVSSVFFSHLSGSVHDRSFGSLGRFGVIIFFVHTSFVLMASLDRLNQTGVSDQSLTLAFWIRRFFRIYPLAILFVILTALFRVPSSPSGTYSWIGLKAFASNLALIQNMTYCPDILGVLWSLPLEVQMYVVLPFAYFAIRRRKQFRSIALWVLSVLLALVVPRVSGRLNMFLYAPCFTAGIVSFDLIRGKTWKWKFPAWVWPVGIFTAIVLFGAHDNVDLPHKMYRAWGLALLLGVLYAHVEEGTHNWVHAVAHWVAEHSYGIYLSHTVVLWIVFFKMGGLPQWLRILALIAGVIGIPAFLYVAVEKPLILAGSHVARRVLGRPVVNRQTESVRKEISESEVVRSGEPVVQIMGQSNISE
jgi:peptidoglycan/LPS O-acetylase OafA/YrhL